MDQETTCDDNSFTIPIDVPVVDPTVPFGYVSGLSADEQDDDLEEILADRQHSKIRSFYRSLSGLRGGRIFSQSIERRDSTDTCNRLYRDAKEKEKRRANEIREKLDQENNLNLPKLNLATTRSYTPMRTRPSSENVHNNLYSLSKKKDETNTEVEQIDDRSQGATISSEQGLIVSGRLYQRSKDMQEEGRKMRKEIEKKLAPRAPTPSKKIPLSQATAMYERGLTHRAQTERKIEDILNTPRESTFPKMKTQGRRRSTSRARSQTPSRRQSDRSTTPSRRRISETTQNQYQKTNQKPPRERKKLPPASLKTREQSPDLRS